MARAMRGWPRSAYGPEQGGGGGPGAPHLRIRKGSGREGGLLQGKEEKLLVRLGFFVSVVFFSFFLGFLG